MKWHRFDAQKGSRQKRPPVGKYVLVCLRRKDEYSAPAVAVGYMKNGGGDKQSPYFVTPGVGGDAVAWADILGVMFQPPTWGVSPEIDA